MYFIDQFSKWEVCPEDLEDYLTHLSESEPIEGFNPTVVKLPTEKAVEFFKTTSMYCADLEKCDFYHGLQFRKDDFVEVC